MDNSKTANLKQVSIVDYLLKKGIKSEKSHGKELFYFSPLTGESGNPSFCVNSEKNVFNDFSSGEKGDVIRLVQLLEKLSFLKACKALEEFEFVPYEKISKPEKLYESKEYINITSVSEISSESLIRYALGRGISCDVLRAVCKEIKYTINFKEKKSEFYGIGFINDRGGWNIRNKNFKGKISVSEISTIKGNGFNLNIFEGFFDYLSFLEIRRMKREEYKGDIIVLNSTANFTLETIKNIPNTYLHVKCFFDADKSGKEAFRKFEKHSTLPKELITYKGFNDLNDFLIDYTQKNRGAS